jgi:hypothetical protein
MAEDQGAGAPAGDGLLHAVGLKCRVAVGDKLKELLDRRGRVADEIYDALERASKYEGAALANRQHAAKLQVRLQVIQLRVDALRSKK